MTISDMINELEQKRKECGNIQVMFSITLEGGRGATYGGSSDAFISNEVYSEGDFKLLDGYDYGHHLKNGEDILVVGIEGGVTYEE